MTFPQLQSTSSSILSLGKGKPFQAFLFSVPGWDTAEKDGGGVGKSLGGGGATPHASCGLLSVAFPYTWTLPPSLPHCVFVTNTENVPCATVGSHPRGFVLLVKFGTGPFTQRDGR